MQCSHHQPTTSIQVVSDCLRSRSEERRKMSENEEEQKQSNLLKQKSCITETEKKERWPTSASQLCTTPSILFSSLIIHNGLLMLSAPLEHKIDEQALSSTNS